MTERVTSLFLFVLFFPLFSLCLAESADEDLTVDTSALADEVSEMFWHAYSAYIEFALPADELRPLTRDGVSILGGLMLTLVDSLDSLLLFGNVSEFKWAVRYVSQNLEIVKDETVSVFETQIRIMGGLLSGHILALDAMAGEYNGELLELAVQLADALLPAFNTTFGIPYGAVNLQYGVPVGETTVTSTAGAGTHVMEFGLLSKLTGDMKYLAAAWRALDSIWNRRSELDLVGNHLDISNGQWVIRDSGIGAGADSFYEYLFKSFILFNDTSSWMKFQPAYSAILEYNKRGPWYVDVNVKTGHVAMAVFNSLQAFWPGLQAQLGDRQPARETFDAFASVWREYGFTPEGFDIRKHAVAKGQERYPLRPELAESAFHLYQSTGDTKYLKSGRDIVQSLRKLRVRAGFAGVRNVQDSSLENRMDSFLLSETFKYLYLLFRTENSTAAEQAFEEDVMAGVEAPTTEGGVFRPIPVESRASEVNECDREGTVGWAPRVSIVPLAGEQAEYNPLSDYISGSDEKCESNVEKGRRTLSNESVGASSIPSGEMNTGATEMRTCPTVPAFWKTHSGAPSPENVYKGVLIGGRRWIFTTEAHLFPISPVGNYYLTESDRANTKGQIEEMENTSKKTPSAEMSARKRRKAEGEKMRADRLAATETSGEIASHQDQEAEGEFVTTDGLELTELAGQLRELGLDIDDEALSGLLARTGDAAAELLESLDLEEADEDFVDDEDTDDDNDSVLDDLLDPEEDGNGEGDTGADEAADQLASVQPDAGAVKMSATQESSVHVEQPDLKTPEVKREKSKAKKPKKKRSKKPKSGEWLDDDDRKLMPQRDSRNVAEDTMEAFEKLKKERAEAPEREKFDWGVRRPPAYEELANKREGMEEEMRKRAQIELGEGVKDYSSRVADAKSHVDQTTEQRVNWDEIRMERERRKSEMKRRDAIREEARMEREERRRVESEEWERRRRYRDSKLDIRSPGLT